jgi:hypothetical protein
MNTLIWLGFSFFEGVSPIRWIVERSGHRLRRRRRPARDRECLAEALAFLRRAPVRLSCCLAENR